MRYISTFSGIEAATVAWEPLGWEPLAFCEIDDFPSAVLAHRYPNVPNLGDITKVDWKEVVGRYGRPDVVVGGSPCQSFSTAGGRESLGGESRLMLEYIRACAEIRSPWILWENVPAVLSTKDDAFGQLIDALQGIGYVSLAWRVLDAQFFGVAQRRRRVFLVGHLGNRGGASAAVLFDRESVRGNTSPSKQKREELARATGRGVAGYGGSYGFCGYASHTASSIGYADETAPTLKGNDWQSQVSDVLHSVAVRTAQTGSNGCGISEETAHTVDTTGPEAVAYATRTCRDGQNVLCMNSSRSNNGASRNVSPTIVAHAAKEAPLVCMEDGLLLSSGNDVVGTLCACDYKIGNEYVEAGKLVMQVDSSDGSVTIHDGSRWVVRRLTPTECERLQGFPDGWTDVPYRGKEHPSDTPRYKAIGNSMAVPVMRWIGERMQMVSDLLGEAERPDRLASERSAGHGEDEQD